MQAKMEEFQREVREREEREAAEAARQREALKVRQKAEREALREAARLRQQAEEKERQARLRTGLLGFWDKLRGQRKRNIELNAQETAEARQRDKAEQQLLTAAQLGQRREVVKERVQQREDNTATARDLTEDAKVFRNMETDAEAERGARRKAFKERRRTEDRPRRRGRQRDGPGL